MSDTRLRNGTVVNKDLANIHWKSLQMLETNYPTTFCDLVMTCREANYKQSAVRSYEILLEFSLATGYKGGRLEVSELVCSLVLAATQVRDNQVSLVWPFM